jgi:hypothetical protein
MDCPTVTTLIQSLHDLALHFIVGDELEYDIVREQFMRWLEPFESFDEIEESVYMKYFWLVACNYGWPPFIVIAP